MADGRLDTGARPQLRARSAGCGTSCCRVPGHVISLARRASCGHHPGQEPLSQMVLTRIGALALSPGLTRPPAQLISRPVLRGRNWTSSKSRTAEPAHPEHHRGHTPFRWSLDKREFSRLTSEEPWLLRGPQTLTCGSGYGGPSCLTRLRRTALLALAAVLDSAASVLEVAGSYAVAWWTVRATAHAAFAGDGQRHPHRPQPSGRMNQTRPPGTRHRFWLRPPVAG